VTGTTLLSGAASVLAQARAWAEGDFSDDLVLILIRPEGMASTKSLDGAPDLEVAASAAAGDLTGAAA
jgi:hypothetical protein